MEKKTVNIPGQLVSSLIIGLLLSFLTVIIIHFFGSWSVSASSEAYNRQNPGIGGSYYFGMDEKAGNYSYSCPLNSYHYFESDGRTTMGDILSNKGSSARVSGAFSGAFDGHWGAIILFTIIYAGIILFFRNFNLKVS
jgi:hypothetical protein